MSSAVQVSLTEQQAPAEFNDGSSCYLQNGTMQVLLQADEELTLRAIQQAGRKLEQLGLRQIEATGSGWSLDRQWALSQGFTNTLSTNQVRWQQDNQETVALLEQMTDTVRWSRELINLPPQDIYPESLCARVVEKFNAVVGDQVSHELLVGEELVTAGWMGTHTVGRASVRPPAMLQLDYNPTGNPDAPVDFALVGKGITFDSGGYSIKPSEGMASMKLDMGGAATVAGALLLAAQRGLNQRVKLILCCAENLIDGSAYKLGDIITYKDGQTVEILNTDAEGRLVMADGLLAAGEMKARRVIDAATLTGAAQVALGNEYNGLFTVNDTLAQQALDSAAAERDPLWRLPLAAWHQNQCPSPFADTANSRAQKGGGVGGASNAAGFLLRFAPEQGQTWLHYDLAGAYQKAAGPLWAAGATGMGIRAISRVMLDQQ